MGETGVIGGSPSFKRVIVLFATAIGVAVAALSSVVIFSTTTARKTLEDTAQRRSYYDAILLSEVLDASFRAVELSFRHFLDETDIGDTQKVAFFVATLMDVDEVVSIFEDGSSSLLSHGGESPYRFDPEALRDLSIGASVKVVPAQSDGGRRIAMVMPVSRPVGAGRGPYAAAIFSGLLLDDRTAILKNEDLRSVRITNAQGKIIDERDFSQPGDSQLGRALVYKTQLRSYPMRVMVVGDWDLSLADWRRGVRLSLSFIVLSLIISVALFVYSRALLRRIRDTEELEGQLRFRGRLFDEVNHRVKNNLQAVASILDIGRSRATERPEEAIEAFLEAETRIHSISLLHERLYRHSELSSTDFGSYLESLTESIQETFGGNRPIQIEVRSKGPVTLSLSKAVPCALIVNELVTNAYKHAFPPDVSGHIELSATLLDQEAVELRISDNGTGLDPENRGSGFGMGLVEAFAEQLHGSISCVPGPDGVGTTWILVFPQDAGQT